MGAMCRRREYADRGLDGLPDAQVERDYHMSKAQRQRHRLKTVAKEWTPFLEVEVTDELRAAAPHLQYLWKRWTNSRFIVEAFQVKSSLGGIVQLSIIRHGLLDVADSYEVERIRLELFGPEYLGIELYGRGVNPTMKMRTLWLMPDGYDVPYGLGKPNAWGNDA